MVISQIVQVGVVRIAGRGEEQMNVIIALLVVTRGTWLGNVTVTRTGVVNRETVDDYSGGTRNSSTTVVTSPSDVMVVGNFSQKGQSSYNVQSARP